MMMNAAIRRARFQFDEAVAAMGDPTIDSVAAVLDLNGTAIMFAVRFRERRELFGSDSLFGVIVDLDEPVSDFDPSAAVAAFLAEPATTVH
jgi:hypothetical protein